MDHVLNTDESQKPLIFPKIPETAAVEHLELVQTS